MSPRGRGIDFEHRFNTSRWAEDLLISALGKEHGLITRRLGISEVRKDKELRYAKDAPYKIPDLLTYRESDLSKRENELLLTTDLVQEPIESFSQGGIFEFAVNKALAAFEVEFSPYRAAEMKGRSWKPKTVEEWRRRSQKNANPPTAPNIFVKEEDLGKLVAWERKFDVPIIVVHLFDQEAFAISLKEIKKFDDKFEAEPSKRVMLQVTSGIFKRMQNYDRTDAQGAGERKMVFRVSPNVAIKVGNVVSVTVKAQLDISASRKYVAHPLFSGGKLVVSADFVRFLNKLDKQ